MVLLLAPVFHRAYTARMSEFDDSREEWHRDNTPEARLLRYIWSINPAMADSPETMYSEALVGFSDIIQHFTDDVDEYERLLGEIFPGPFDPRELEFDDWYVQLGLAPLRLLERGLPVLDDLSLHPRYIDGLFAAALNWPDQHRADCVEKEGKDMACETMLICPARAVRDIMLRQAGLLVVSRHVYESPEPEARRIDGRIDQIRNKLISYALCQPEEMTAILGVMNRGAKQFFDEITSPPPDEE